jgi:hypothetical protein
MTRLFRCLYALVLLALAGGSLFAQVPAGTPPLGSFGGGPDVIDLANLNAHLTVPVYHRAGRGLPFDFFLTYDSSIWFPVTSNGAMSWKARSSFGWNGTELKIGYISASVSTNTVIMTCPVTHLQGGTLTSTYAWTYSDGFGTPHLFSSPSTVVTNLCTGAVTNTGGGGIAADGSGYTLTATGSVVNSLIAADGNIITAPINSNTGAGSVQDRNGNQVSVSSSNVFTDTLGTTALSITGGPAPSPVNYTYTPPGGTNVSVVVRYSAFTVATNFGCSPISDYGATAS